MLHSKSVRRIAFLLAALMLLAALPARSLAASVFTVRVTSATAYIYRTASTASAKLKVVSQNEVLECGAAKSNWAYVRYNGITGYVRTSDLCYASNNQPMAPASTTDSAGNSSGSSGTSSSSGSSTGTAASSSVSVVTTTALRLYRSPSTSSAYYGTIAKGKTLTCMKVSGSWAYVQAGKYKGYVLKSGLAAKSSGSSTGGSSSPSTPSTSSISNTGVSCYIKGTTVLLATASMSAATVCELAIGEKVTVTHIKSNWCRIVTSKGQIGYLPYSLISKTKIYVNGNIVLMDWFKSDIQKLFPVGSKVSVTDVLTRQTFKVYRRGGINHADCEPLTKSDTSTILSIYGGSTSWTRRAIWVTIGNVTYAASMNFMNHGQQTITTNGFNGHFCIHFYNSRTSGTNKVDADHQAAVLLAYATKP